MFTGIVEEKGKVVSINRKGNSMIMMVEGPTVSSDVTIGDSISVNGVCLTVTSFSGQQFSVDVIPETFHSSSLSGLFPGAAVNLERAMSASGRFGGHFVSGHVDAVGTIKAIHMVDNAAYYHIQIPSEGLAYIALKGSISVDGVSLTVFELEEDNFVISLIPETRRATVLGEKGIGDVVNVEYDMLAKYMDRLLSSQPEKYQNNPKKASLTESKLAEYGFLD